MKKVYIQAYLNLNLGDDLFVRYLANKYPNVSFYMKAPTIYKKVFYDISNIFIIPSDKKSMLQKKIYGRLDEFLKKKSNMIIFIGGSIFMEYKNWNNIISWYDYLFSSNETYVLGANFGPYKTEKYREELEKIFIKVSDVCFRDLFSFNSFKSLKNVRYAPDILFGFEYLPKIKKEEKKVFISVIDLKNRKKYPENLDVYSKDYLIFLKKIVEIYGNKGFDIILSSFCENQRDSDTIKYIINSVDLCIQNKISVLIYDGTNWKSILDQIYSSSCVIATRFHCIVFALKYKVPVLPIIYNKKTENLLNDINFQGNCIEIDKINKNQINEFITNTCNENIIFENAVLDDESLNKLSSNSLNHFEKINSVLL